MTVHVVDASALGALVFGEPEADAVVERLGSKPLAAPVLIRFELANICLKKIKAHPSLEKKLLDAHELGTRIALQFTDVDHNEVIQLARKSGLSAYDASYLWLALRLRAELITLDIKMKAAAARLGIVAPGIERKGSDATCITGPAGRPSRPSSKEGRWERKKRLPS